MLNGDYERETKSTTAAGELAACLGDEARGLMVWWSVRWRSVVLVNNRVVSESS